MQRAPLGPDTAFVLAHPRIIHESVEADALLIDLDRGVYYNLEGVAATIWKGAVTGLPLDAIAVAVERNHSGCEEELRPVVAGFVQALIDEGLLTPAPVSANGAGADAVRAEGQRTPYRAPTLERHTDLEQLLRADPICEVREPTA
jgi:hypothetical protein